MSHFGSVMCRFGPIMCRFGSTMCRFGSTMYLFGLLMYRFASHGVCITVYIVAVNLIIYNTRYTTQYAVGACFMRCMFFMCELDVLQRVATFFALECSQYMGPRRPIGLWPPGSMRPSPRVCAKCTVMSSNLGVCMFSAAVVCLQTPSNICGMQ